MKRRLRTVKTGNAGVTAIHKFCDDHDLIFQAEPREDYGIDCYVEIAEGEHPLGFYLGIQSKSGPSYVASESADTLEVRLDQDDLAYWLGSNVPVFFAHYLESTGALHMVHVQEVLRSHAGPLDELTRVRFDKARDRANALLAERIRNIARQTPSDLDRMDVALCDEAVFEYGSVSVPIRPSPPVPLDVLHELGDKWHEPYYNGSRVIAFSESGEWLILQSATALGMKCTEAHLKYVHLASWQECVVPLFLNRDYDEHGGAVPDPEFSRRRGSIARLSDEVKATAPVHVRLGDAAEGSSLVIRFDEHAFEISVQELSPGQSSLVLRNTRYVPPRDAVLALERSQRASHSWKGPAEIAKLHLPEVHGYRPKALRDIVEVAFDHSAKTIVIGVATNLEHNCRGNSDVHHFMFAVSDIRARCVDALRR